MGKLYVHVFAKKKNTWFIGFVFLSLAFFKQLDGLWGKTKMASGGGENWYQMHTFIYQKPLKVAAVFKTCHVVSTRCLIGKKCTSLLNQRQIKHRHKKTTKKKHKPFIQHRSLWITENSPILRRSHSWGIRRTSGLKKSRACQWPRVFSFERPLETKMRHLKKEHLKFRGQKKHIVASWSIPGFQHLNLNLNHVRFGFSLEPCLSPQLFKSFASNQN